MVQRHKVLSWFYGVVAKTIKKKKGKMVGFCSTTTKERKNKMQVKKWPIFSAIRKKH